MSWVASDCYWSVCARLHCYCLLDAGSIAMLNWAHLLLYVKAIFSGTIIVVVYQ